MYQRLKGNKKGFTLAELLIVIAIVAILAAIAIPLYTNQMTSARLKVNESNVRSAISIASNDFLLEGRSAATDYPFTVGTNLTMGTPGNADISRAVSTTASGDNTYTSITVRINADGSYAGFYAS